MGSSTTTTSVNSGAEKTDSFIPLVDFAPLLTPGPSPEKTATGYALLHAFQTAGFVYLKNYGIPQEVVDEVFKASASFFALPQPTKDNLGWYSPRANRGYVAHGREKVTELTDSSSVASLRNQNPDLKESLEIGREGEPGCPNRWPEDHELPHFKTTMLHFHARCKTLHQHVMRGIALGLGLPEHHFDPVTTVGDNTLRLLHYPATPRHVFDAARARGRAPVRAGEHTDYGSVTLLFQQPDDRGGLQAQDPRSGAFVDARPIPGTVVVNAGDLLARWSNDVVRSTRHRVVEPPPGKKGMEGEEEEEEEEGDVYPARYSVAYFCNPDFDTVIQAIPGTVPPGETPRYEPVRSGEYLERRLAATY